MAMTRALKALTSATAQRRLDRILSRIQASRGVCRLKPKPLKPWIVQVSLVGSARMTKLNFQYRKKRRPTDVLSFPAPEIFSAHGLLGELVICLPVLRRQARERKHSDVVELDVLLVHGVLHLLGWDHERSAREEKAMTRLEDHILRGRGLIRRSR